MNNDMNLINNDTKESVHSLEGVNLKIIKCLIFQERILFSCYLIQ